MSRIGFVLASSVLFASAAVGACSHLADDCENTSTCEPVGGGSNAGSTSGGKAGTPTGGNTSSGSGGEGGTVSGGGSSGGKGGGGTAGGAGDAGAGGVVSQPCDGACTAPKVVCDEPTDTCVECLDEGDCAGGAKKKCDTAAKTCVECLASTECATAAAAKCDGGACVKCTSNDDCAHVAGKTVCDTAAGECVQCTVGNEASCAGKSCDPATRSCTTTPVGSRDYCQSCLADSECIGATGADPEARCVPMKFGATQRPGGFCLRRDAKTCTKPFSTLMAAKSLSGAASEDYCGIDQDNVRCEAVLDLLGSAECGDGQDTSCGCTTRDQQGKCTDTGVGGLCKKVGAFNNRCTYSCGVTDDCPTGKVCTSMQPYCH